MKIHRNVLFGVGAIVIAGAAVSIRGYQHFNPPITPIQPGLGADWVGKTAPNFELKDDSGKTIKSADFFGKKPTLVIFHNGTAGIHSIADVLQVSNSAADLAKHKVDVLCVSTEPPKQTRVHLDNWNSRTSTKRVDKPFHFLDDKDGKVADSFGAYNHPSTDGAPTFVRGSAFVVDLNGKIVFADITHSLKQPYQGKEAMQAAYRIADAKERPKQGAAPVGSTK